MSETARPRLMVVAHHAGGTEIISSWLRRHREEWEPVFVLCGPAPPPGAKPISLPFPEIEQLFGGPELTGRAAP
jgi:hypothetical protein